MMTTVFGQFLELSIPTDDIQESLNFYRKLGFSELSVNDIRTGHYGVVTDGRITIGLHGDGINEPALSFVKSDVASYLQHVRPDGEELSFSHLDTEHFHEIGVYTPDGHLLIIMEARTFSRANLSELPIPLTGRAVEISLGSHNISNAAIYWTDAGFLANGDAEDDTAAGKIELLAPGLQLGIYANLRAGQTALRFAPDDFTTTLDYFARTAIEVCRTNDGCYLTSPEGIRLYIVDTTGTTS